MTWEAQPTRVALGVHPVAIVALPLPLVCAGQPPVAAGRFAAPPWDRDTPDWHRLDAKLPADHLARKIGPAVEQLDLTGLFAAYTGTGSLAHRPDLILKVVLYEVQRGRHSPAQWAEDFLLDEACQWLALGIRPSRSRLYAFRDRLGPLVDGLNEGVIGAAVAAGLTDATQASLDGTTVAAHASRHRLLNEEALTTRQQVLAAAVAADATGSAPEVVPGWMAATPSGRQTQAERYACAHEQLDRRHQENQQRPASKRLAAKDVRISPGDPEAVLGVDKLKVYRPLYNVQWMPDLKTPLVLTWEVFAQATDAGTLPAMLSRCRQATGRCPKDLLTDAGYATALDLAACQQAAVTLYAPYQENDYSATRRAGKKPKQIPKSAFRWEAAEHVYVCPQGHRLEQEYSEVVRRKGEERLRVFTYRCPPEHCGACPRRQECSRSPGRGRTLKRSEHEELVEALKGRMQTEEAKQLYRRRCQTVELGFADLKEHRGLRRFRSRGLARVRIEVGLVVLAHNALTVRALRHKSKDRNDANSEISSG
jgi:transposase